MIVPKYWADGRAQDRRKGRQVTVRRFGWSNTNQYEAQQNANQRASDALNRLLAGEKLARYEPKIPYNGADGVPIREEIVSTIGDSVITRNSYGARCLNTPNVLFADIDFNTSPSQQLLLIVFVFVFVFLCAIGITVLFHSKILGVSLAFLSLFLGKPLAGVFNRAKLRSKGGVAEIAKRKIVNFLAANPDWNLRLYRSPAGFRVIVMHQPFLADDQRAVSFLNEIGSDPLYVKMCAHQKCFRARLTAKPWRIGIEAHMKPRPGTWPIAPIHISKRNAWIEEYESVAKSFAACSFIEDLGSGVVDPYVNKIRDLHDELSGALSGFPIA